MLLDQLATAVSQALPLDTPADIKSNIRSVLSDQLARMDLVTREEFDVQRKVLARTRARLEALEQRVTELEGKT